ncbi:hydantoinase/oxoprolinase family protein [Paralcaligenes ureilyticus]|uniref:N-methylhydantoinase A n=1 Tax=Paralcaligenes ureilyticus TaxID=627131 RepID=A0A4R3LRC6_9BURK|nr:hydantoinase/oxoprolinase family protein [Paralcaligenes ureilyticus]TCT03073.1 N-methylhydantoinase A [Paralcaligenes ureilyticus]
MCIRVGVDIGGSYTDFAVLDERDGKLTSLKVFSRPDAPGQEVVDGLRKLSSQYAIDLSRIGFLTHGTTVGVNTVVQRVGARLALITTKGFEDVLEIARLKTPNMYHLLSKRPVPLISRKYVFGIKERTSSNGEVTLDVEKSDVLDVIKSIREADCDGVVVALMHSYRNPTNEHKIRDIISAVAPDLGVSCSFDTWPIIREYERTQTAAVGAYAQPKVGAYLTRLDAALVDMGISTNLKVTKSNGGVMSAAKGKESCIQMILSGTASGVIGAAYTAKQCGIRNCISLDIGGTTADAALIIDGQAQYAAGEYIGDYQIYIPSVSVTSIGDGGGTVAWVDNHGVLKVGPESAGSTPGPACFGRGGNAPTITDAFVVLGILGHSELGYSTITVDAQRARNVIGQLGEKLNLSPEATSEMIVNVAVSGMYAGVSRLMSKFGVDPRTFTLLPFGGAGPMLSCYLARALNMGQIMVPLSPGVLSALGGLIADTKNDFVKTTYYDFDSGDNVAQLLTQDLADLENEARMWMMEQAGTLEGSAIEVSADMRYRGQSFELETPLNKQDIVDMNITSVREAFNSEHLRHYGYEDRQASVQLIALRLVIRLPTSKPTLKTLAAGTGSPEPLKKTSVWINGDWHDVPVYRRGDLLADQRFDGPAIVFQEDCTTWVLPELSCHIDNLGNMFLSDRVETGSEVI